MIINSNPPNSCPRSRMNLKKFLPINQLLLKPRSNTIHSRATNQLPFKKSRVGPLPLPSLSFPTHARRLNCVFSIYHPHQPLQNPLPIPNYLFLSLLKLSNSEPTLTFFFPSPLTSYRDKMLNLCVSSSNNYCITT